MRFLGADERRTMDVRRRDDILALISAGREIEAAAILSPKVVLSSPEVPIDPRMVALASASKTFDSHDLVVRGIESRLKAREASSWRELSSQESQSLNEWARAADEMGQAVQQTAPPAPSGNTGLVFLVVLAAAAILVPVLFIKEPEPDTGLPSRGGRMPERPPFAATQRRGGEAYSELPTNEGGRLAGREGRFSYRGGAGRRFDVSRDED